MPPHCVIEDVTDKWDPEEGDKQLGDMLIKHEGDAGKFLVTVLGFLKRKSNFFKGDDPKRRLLEAYKEVAGEPAAPAGMKGGFLGGAKAAAGAAAEPAQPAAEAGPQPSSSAAAPAQEAAAAPVPAEAPAASAPEAAPEAAPAAAEAAPAAPEPAAAEAAAEPAAAAEPSSETVPDAEDDKPKGLSESSWGALGRGCWPYRGGFWDGLFGLGRRACR
ncbi:hypothetical protein GPECTOR_24g195 [Gonium pectorale]|uniref:Uncharacterized protein n=1 Tax=Gonium pectorale TaxID=33097 RepID=A0A150GGF1_GONPE|nr:hypothetical protein GPECTOR_24g195 [Gonium pectorale]|eukprot:KXZ48906.1 hypothetical protein GPECTOR_24g195 [Gonium pectorale]